MLRAIISWIVQDLVVKLWKVDVGNVENTRGNQDVTCHCFSGIAMSDTVLRVFKEEADNWPDWYEAVTNYIATTQLRMTSMKLTTLRLHGGPEIRKLLKNLKKDLEDRRILHRMQKITLFQGMIQ